MFADNVNDLLGIADSAAGKGARDVAPVMDADYARVIQARRRR